MTNSTRILGRACIALLGLGILGGVSGCTARTASGGAGSGSDAPAPAALSCPAGVEDAAAQGLKDFGLYGDVQTQPASASDTPLDAVAQNLSGAVCIVGFVGTNGVVAQHGTIAFLPAELEEHVVAALGSVGYTNKLQEYTYTQGGQITSSEIADVTITPADYWSVDFTPLFSQPILVVTTTVGN